MFYTTLDESCKNFFVVVILSLSRKGLYLNRAPQAILTLICR